MSGELRHLRGGCPGRKARRPEQRRAGDLTLRDPGGSAKKLADLAKVIGILRDANYRGYVALEYEAAEDANVAVPRHLAELRKLIG